jgi:hypothetical protein
LVALCGSEFSDKPSRSCCVHTHLRRFLFQRQPWRRRSSDQRPPNISRRRDAFRCTWRPERRRLHGSHHDGEHPPVSPNSMTSQRTRRGFCHCTLRRAKHITLLQGRIGGSAPVAADIDQTRNVKTRPTIPQTWHVLPSVTYKAGAQFRVGVVDPLWRVPRALQHAPQPAFCSDCVVRNPEDLDEPLNRVEAAGAAGGA